MKNQFFWYGKGSATVELLPGAACADADAVFRIVKKEMTKTEGAGAGADTGVLWNIPGIEKDDYLVFRTVNSPESLHDSIVLVGRAGDFAPAALPLEAAQLEVAALRR